MRKINLLIVVLTFLSISSIYGRDRARVNTAVTSTEVSQINGSFQFNIQYSFLDDVQFSTDANIELPNGWSISFTPSVGGNSYANGLNVSVTATVTYPSNNIPYFPEDIKMSHFLSDNGEEVYESVKVYFTPYNTIEIWNLEDFYNLPRRWLTAENSPYDVRQYIALTDIPTSNINTTNEINWFDASKAWDDDSPDDYREVIVPGLAYAVLKKPVPKDSIIYYKSIGDGPDSTSAKGYFEGSVAGTITATFVNDIGASSTIPIAGIKVRLMEKDLIGNWEIAETYTDENGNYTLTYGGSHLFEGDRVELSVQVKSITSDTYKVVASNSWGDRYEFNTAQWSAGSSAYGQTQDIDFAIQPFTEPFKAIHWARRGFQYFQKEGASLGSGLRIKPLTNNGSWFEPALIPPTLQPTIHLENGRGRREGTTYHEFGHYAMMKLQGNNFTIPYGENGFGHRWDEENTSLLAWSEGWADAIEMILDGAYWYEDNEYGQDHQRYEDRRNFSQGINNGFRSEYYIACAIYDLWDGSDKNLPTTRPDQIFHGWNDSGQGSDGWESLDDVQLSLYEICKPLIDHPSGNGGYYFNEKIKNIQDYYRYLIYNNYNNCDLKADISRVFRENRVLWDIEDYERNWNISNLSSDQISKTEIKYEDPSSALCSDWNDYYLVNYYNKNATNDFQYIAYEYDAGVPFQLDHKITDNLWLGIWDDVESIYRRSNLSLNDATGGLQFATYATCGGVNIDIRNGNLKIGADNGETRANLEINDGSLLRFRGNGYHNDLLINSNSNIIINAGGSLYIESGADLVLKDYSSITVKPGGYICIETGANINLEGVNSIIELEAGAQQGINPVHNIAGSCIHPQDVITTGQGRIIIHNCEDFASYTDYDELIVNSSTVWDNTYRMHKENIIVQSGAELEIKNQSVVEMAKGRKIIVEPGARLVVNNSTITHKAECSDMWGGIQIKGNRNQNQMTTTIDGFLQYQGEVILQNCTIKNALFGVDIYKEVEVFGGYTVKTGGGVLKADNVDFIDNKTDIQMYPYQGYHNQIKLANATIIENSRFKTTNQLLDNNVNINHLILKQVNGIRIRGNTFINANTSLPTMKKGVGIYSTSASFKLVDQYGIHPSSPKLKNTFENLFYGVRAMSSLNQSIIRIKGNEFKDVYRSVYLHNTLSSEVLYNSIKISEMDVSVPLEDGKASYGIFIFDGNGFKVEENEITKFGAVDAGLFGIIVHNTGANNNEIYKNSLNDLNVGIMPQLKNRGTIADQTHPEDGLKLICNEYDNPSYDVWVAGKNSSNNAPGVGIARTQLFSDIDQSNNANNYPAGNIFTSAHQNTTADYDISNSDAEHFVYYYAHSASGKTLPDQVSNVAVYLHQESNYCPSRDNNIVDLSTLYDDLHFAHVALNSSRLVLNIWQNGGDADLGEEVETIQPWDVYVEFNDLLAESPYLSEDVLIAVIENPSFTSLMIKILMIENPHAINSDEVMDVLYNREPPLPESYINEILDEEGEISQLDHLKANVAADYHLVRRIGENIKRIYRDDSENEYALDSLINFLSRQQELSDHYELAHVFLINGFFDEMTGCLDAIPYHFDLSEQEFENHQDYVTLFGLMEDIFNVGVIEGHLTNEQYETVYNVSEKNQPGTSSIAIALLEGTAPGDRLWEPILMPDEEKSGWEEKDGITGNKELNATFNIYPNPAYDFVTIRFDSDEMMNKYNYLTVEIYDVTGKKVISHPLESAGIEFIIDLTELSTGVYTVSLLGDGQFISTKKLDLID